ncbi:6-phosphogluconolactonase 4 [Tubulinosema ratisbonensis]|uniref:6-phosphogluconolactonase 4 n=1 Tax=Tubulinosema ratisbonensis TaxID=291195 RepID=A0A437AL35_9MICR|nr:6-phosphogluconolactonase 4 [Tubulinosema ratisbonensis]
MISQKLINDFEKEVYDILLCYSGKEANIMVAGGSVLKVLENINYTELNTAKWQIFFSDERIDSEDTNFDAAKVFFSKIYSNKVPFSCISEYNTIFSNISVDLALLGIGEDGHVASLFPNSRSLKSNDYFIQINNSPKPPPKRNTITLKFINEKVMKLIFLLPPVNNKVKEVKQPHFSILEKLKLPFTVFLKK